MTYPSGRGLTYSYGSSSGMDDALSRISSLIDNDGVTHLADYTRLGRSTFVQMAYAQPQTTWSLINGSGNDPYSGLDQFNRVADNRWFNTSSNSDVDRVQHGYDRASNRLWRKNTVADAAGVYLDELYSYDGLYRLAGMQRGQLNGANNGIVSGTLSFAQAWGLDATGNWQQFWQNSTGSTWDLQQSRTATKANEITTINGGGWTQPAYDAAGNMMQLPQSSSASTANAATFDAWNRMMAVYSGGSLIQQNTYDGENRRVTKSSSAILRHWYFTPSWQTLEERVGASSTPDRQFLWGLRYVDDLVVRDRSTERFYALQDANWNITGIVTASSAISERYVYAAYGSPAFLAPSFSAVSSSAYGWESLFATYRFDASTGLYEVRNRILHAVLGLWLQRDPVADGSATLYSYADLAPVRLTDPSGLLLGSSFCCVNRKTVVPYRIPAPEPLPGPNVWPHRPSHHRELHILDFLLQVGNCGDYDWQIRWQTNTPAGPAGAFVLQHIVAKYYIETCDGKDITAQAIQGNRDGGTTIEYWEAFRIAPMQNGAQAADHYTGSTHPCTRGNVAVTGTATLIDGQIPNPPLIPNNPALPWPRGLPSTDQDPHLTSRFGTVRHDLVAEWDCCQLCRENVA